MLECLCNIEQVYTHEDAYKMINSGMGLIMKTTLRLLGKQGGGNTTLALQDKVDDETSKEDMEDEAHLDDAHG
jgi:hypothetical protein